ncbi:MAG TPA: cupin domain-containing protein [Opitutaceae bacterium]|nr:cupin domain-containing protein [Opitutaceae bacterium]
MNSSSEYFTAERCYITELHNSPDDPGCSVARARVLPGVTTQRHALHGVAERYVVIEGTGRVEVGGVAVDVGPSSVVSIPADVSQRVTNTGTGDLVFLCVCEPRFTPEAYLNLD